MYHKEKEQKDLKKREYEEMVVKLEQEEQRLMEQLKNTQ